MNSLAIGPANAPQMVEGAANPLDLFIAAIDALEASAAPLKEPAKAALGAMIDAVDVAFQTAIAIAAGADPKSRAVRTPFLFVTMKLVEVNGLLGQAEDSKAVRCLQAMEKVR